MAEKEIRKKQLDQPRDVRLKPSSYQPSKAELEENVKIDATPDALAHALLRPVKVIKDRDA